MTAFTGAAVSPIGAHDMTADQLALSTSQRVTVLTPHGPITGGRVRNGVQVFLNVPYGLEVPRWTDPQPLPEDYRYEAKEYTKDGLYACQPEVRPPESDRRNGVGLGEPTESPFFADIYIPSSFKLGVDPPKLPVKVFIHGGFLQGGSTSGFGNNQQFFAAEHGHELRVLLGYRLGVLGFLAADSPRLDGNWGFKDVWLGLEWIQRNIHSFGGNPSDVHISGQSAGAHLIHNILHHAAKLAPIQAPFVTATLYSNSLLEDPFSLQEHQHQFESLCRACHVDPTDSQAVHKMSDRDRLHTERLFSAMRSLGLESSFVPVAGGWLSDEMTEYQRRGDLGRDLMTAGVRCIILGDVRDENEGYKNAHECSSENDIVDNWSRWNRRHLVESLYETYPTLPRTAGGDDFQNRLGDCLGDARVRLPIRLFAEDLINAGMPVIRYTIEMVARNLETNGSVTHGSDLALHFFRLSLLTQEEMESTLKFYRQLQPSVDAALRNDGSFVQRDLREVLAMEADGTVAWRDDWRWQQLRMQLAVVRPA